MSEPDDKNRLADSRLQRLLGGEQLASLRKRLRRRFERAPAERSLEHIRINRLAAEEHAALASLLGRPQRPSDSLQIDVRLVDAVLRRSGVASSLCDALERLDGPITNLSVARLREENLWSRIIEGCSHPDLTGFFRSPEGISLLKRLARQDTAAAVELCRGTEAVLQHLPAKGIARSQLAADVLGDAHALDNGEPVATIVLAVLRRFARAPSKDGLMELTPDPQQAKSTERTRDIWATSGVLVNELARPALFLNLPTKTAQNGCRNDGEPTYLSLRALLRSPPSWEVAGRKVHVCENPNLLAIAADHWGRNCAPIVCVEGMPAAAQQCLLSQLAQAGALLYYHGDFDWPGLRIGNYVMREFGARPWRFRVTDYIAAMSAASNLRHPLKGSAVEAAWDQALAAAMQQHRISVAEEALASSLLQDLDGRLSA